MSSPRSYLLQWVYHSPANDVYPTLRYESRYEARAVSTNKVRARKEPSKAKPCVGGRCVARGFARPAACFIPLFRPLLFSSLRYVHSLTCPPPQNPSHVFFFFLHPCRSSSCVARKHSLSFPHSSPICCNSLPPNVRGIREAGLSFCAVFVCNRNKDFE